MTQSGPGIRGIEKTRWASTFLAVGVLGLLGCADAGDEMPDAMEGGGEAQEGTVPMSVPVSPVDTTPEAVWAYLQAQGYGDSWTFWPGKEPFYEGIEPHGVLLSTYLNGPALAGFQALKTGEAEVQELPYGSMLVKENYGPDSTLMAVTVMYKVEGFDPPHQDWWWMKRLADGTVEASGAVESCAQCHGKAATPWDYLLTAAAEAAPGGQ